MGEIVNQLLTKRDLFGILDLINESLSCASEDDIKHLLIRLRELVPHDFVICGLAEIGTDGSFDSYKTLNVNYPDEWIELYIAKKYNLCDPVFVTNFGKFGLQNWLETYKHNPPSRKFLVDAHDFGLTQGYTYGMRSRSQNTNNPCSLFSFSGKSVEQHERTNIVLGNVMPHLHEALIRAQYREDKEKSISSVCVSAREKEVLIWLKEGKSSWDISKILSISERTVNYHVSNIMQKLGAVNRIHAVAIAAGLKLIELD